MSGRRSVTWGMLVAICQRRNIEIRRGKGGERKLKGPDLKGHIRVMRIGHNCCTRHNAVVYIDYVKAFQRRFGVSDEELYG